MRKVPTQRERTSVKIKLGIIQLFDFVELTSVMNRI